MPGEHDYSGISLIKQHNYVNVTQWSCWGDAHLAFHYALVIQASSGVKYNETPPSRGSEMVEGLISFDILVNGHHKDYVTASYKFA